ncbi:MAG: zinc ribbon domain-containing protein [Candidatus Poseidoniaceae archaeon]|nr:zinc ribbon domain-containing protein [Candidatus Poseidoniaceae archaeon]
MAFCTNCGQMLADGTRFCRFCGSQQPGDQLIARLRMEAESIRYRMQQMQTQQMQGANYGQQQNQRRW